MSLIGHRVALIGTINLSLHRNGGPAQLANAAAENSRRASVLSKGAQSANSPTGSRNSSILPETSPDSTSRGSVLEVVRLHEFVVRGLSALFL